MRKFGVAVAALVLLCLGTVLGQTSASLSGTVRDATGAVIPGASVVLTEPSRSVRLETITTDEGTFTFPTLQPGVYTVTVEMAGFQQVAKQGIIVGTGEKQSAGTIVMQIGEVTSTIQVLADASQLQIRTRSGEQAEMVTGRQVRELAINGRNYLDLVKLVPGVVSTGNFQVAGPGGFGNISVNGTRMNQHNLTIDGSTNVDTGSNGTQHVALNLDTIEEFKVLTSNYQAEYGRSGGGDIKITTRSGTNQFHGSAYLFHRHEGLNANSYFNTLDGNSRSLYRYNYFGYTVGGPVNLPSKYFRDRMFFFWSQDWAEQLLPATARQVRVPTAAELAGNFSQTRDGNGNLITVKDPTTGQPFPNGQIPSNRFNESGLNILKLFNKHENQAERLPLYNHNSQSSANYPRRQYTVRLDYNLTDNTRVFARYTQDSDEQVLPYGVGWTSGQNFPLTPTVFKQGPAKNAALNITTVLSPTMTNEFVFGPSQNNLTLDPVDPSAATFAGIGLKFTPPFPYSPHQFVNFEFGGVPNQTFAAITNYSQFPYKNSNTTFDFYDNFSKIKGNHALKFGVYVQRQRKDQAAGDSMRINFNTNVNNPLDAGHPYANALLGNFNWLRAPNREIGQGQYRSTNFEWYVQDNWRATNRLTLDYGIRFSYIGPQYDARDQDRYFDPNSWDPSKAVRLYMREASGRAYDPAKPDELLPGYLVGRIVPGSGDPFNGMRGPDDGWYRGGFKARAPQIGPALGFAWDMFGTSKTVLRGGYRVAYDRVSGNTSIFPAVGQPPVFLNPQFDFGNLDVVGSVTEVLLAPASGVHSVDTSGKIPMVQSFSMQIQQQVGLDSVLSVGYVGTLSTHLWQRENLNYSPYHTLFQKEAQDPSQSVYGGVVPDVEPGLPQVYADAGFNFSGRYALPAWALRRYPGYNDIGFRGPSGSSNYHSMQVTLQRRYGHALTYGLAYTWSKAMSTANGDGDYTNPVCARCYDYRRASFDRTHNLAINYVWLLPKASEKLPFQNFLTRGILDNWQLSGINIFMSGQPEEVTIGIPNVNMNQRITGSWTEGPRAVLVADPQPQKSHTAWFDYNAFRLPNIGDIGPWSRTYIERPGILSTDLSVFKNFPAGESRNLQFRLEMFNVFNKPVFSDANRGLTFNIRTDFANYSANQQASSQTLRNVRGGVNSPASGRLGRALGEVNGQPGNVAGNRVIQLALKFYF
jgi:outer membrane receptor protein involved in Fe transport